MSARCMVDIAECRGGGSLATWRSVPPADAWDVKPITVCDRHKAQYDERYPYDDETPLVWEPLGLVEEGPGEASGVIS